jgi:hypothetical protein
MGYKRPVNHALVKVKDGRYAGLELTLNLSVSMELFIDFQRKRFSNIANIDSQEEALRWFASDVLVAWNMEEDDGSPVPASADGFMSLEPSLALEIVSRWRETVTDIDAPLVSPSTDGEPSKVQSIPRQARRSASRSKR